MIGDLSGIGIVIVYGLLLGNVQASRCQLRTAGQIHGDITCKSMAMDPDVILIGTVNVNPQAPNFVDHEGKVIGKKKPKRKKGPNETPSASVVSSPRVDEKEESWASPTKENKQMSNSNSKDGKMSVSNSKKSVGGEADGKMSVSNSKKSVGGEADGKMSVSNSKKSVAADEKKSSTPPPGDKQTPHIEPAEEPPAELEKTPFDAALDENKDAVADAEAPVE